MFSKKMSPTRKILFVVAALIVVLAVILILVAPSLQRSFFYPSPRGLPAVVDQPADDLLARLEAVLEAKAPEVARSLQPGLSVDQIASLESKGAFQLSDELRTLYRWHNGMSTNSAGGLIPGHRFLPLEEVVSEHLLIRQQTDSASLAQRAAFAVFAGHKKGWVHVLDDAAGDGYFYDPERPEAEGAFFYHMAEVGYYVWFPSLQNFLAGAVECYESGAIKDGAVGELEEDYDRTDKIWRRFGTSSDY